MNTSSYFGQVRRYLESQAGVLAPTNGGITTAIGECLELNPQKTGCVLSKMSSKDLLQFAGPSPDAPRAIWLPPKNRNYSLVTEEEIFWRVRKWIRTLPTHDAVQVYGYEHLAALSGLPPTEGAGSKARVELAKYDSVETLAFDDERWPWEVMHVYELIPA